MTPELYLMALVFIVLMIVRVPVAFAIMGAVIAYFLVTPHASLLFPQRLASSLSSFPVLAIPLFILAGSVMARGGLAMRLIRLADSLVGHMKGGLGQVAVINSLFIGGMSGSAKADSAIDAKILVPVMQRYGYDLGFSSALTAAAGIIAPLIPPSIGLILYGLLANVSIGHLFIAGIVPGFLVAIALMIVVRIQANRRGFGIVRQHRLPLREVLKRVRASWHALLIPVGIIGGLRIGVFTPTELAAVIAVYSIIISVFVYKELDWNGLRTVFIESALLTAAILIIISAAGALGYVLTLEQIPHKIALALISAFKDPLIALLVINIVLLLLGTIMESTSLLVIVTPVLAPAVISMGVDPVQFGIILVFNMTIGGITPPVGGNMFTVMAITGVSMADFAREILPFLAALIVVLLLLTYIPVLSVGLPSILL
ncbi:MAG: TRAP transporter large permease [Hyphomicrobiales bacterium]|nr:TRAP transporter large permease [Hyphomicrobiales bacterium]